MAEAGVIAAAYAAETAVEAAAVGAFAVAKSTVPLHVNFHKLPSPNRLLTRSSHTLTVVKGKAYIYGGDVQGHDGDDNVHAITLPSDLDLNDLDYQAIPAVVAPDRPLANYGDEATTGSKGQKNAIPAPRAAHTATCIDSTIYIFGGRPPTSPIASSPLSEGGIIHTFDTTNNTWSTLTPHPTRCSSGVPCPRTYASSSSTPHPQSTGNHGTLLLHGGYDADGKQLRDVWAFDVASRIWSQWPDIPGVGPQDIEGEGKIICTESRLWRCGDGFGKVVYLPIVRDDMDDFSGVGEMGISPKTGSWETVSFGPINVSRGTAEDEIEAKMGRPGMQLAEAYPGPRTGAGFVPITTGAGREYLLLFMGKEGEGSVLGDVWSFQIKSDKKTPAMLKDGVRRFVGMQTGEDTWAKAEVVEATKKDGPVELPKGLSRFGFGSLKDFGSGGIVIWGGISQGGDIVGEGWVMIAE